MEGVEVAAAAGYEYRYGGFAIDESISPPPSYTVRRYPYFHGAKTFLFQMKIDFKLKRISSGVEEEEEEEVMASETFYASPMQVDKISNGAAKLFKVVARRMTRSYGMPWNQVSLFANAAYAYAAAAAADVDGDVMIIPVAANLEVVTNQGEGEEVESAKQRAISPHNKVVVVAAAVVDHDHEMSLEQLIHLNATLSRWLEVARLKSGNYN